MLKNYFKLTLRILKRNPSFSLINITGLATGIACSLLIFLYVSFELSYDRYHEDANRIYRVMQRSQSQGLTQDSGSASAPLTPVLRENFSEVESATRFQPLWQGGRCVVERGETKFYETLFMYSDPEIFKVLTIPFLKGDPETALQLPNRIVITQSMAEKYFGSQNPMGETISIQGFYQKKDYEVSGVVADPPPNTHIKYGLIVSLSSFPHPDWYLRWNWEAIFAYIKLRPNVKADDFENKIKDLAYSYQGEELKNQNLKKTFHLQPITRIHLHSRTMNEIEPPGKPMYVTLFTAIGILILLIACFNYMNLNTARSTLRAREVGIRKVIGATRSQLVRQLLGESMVFSFLSMIFAVFAIRCVLPFYNRLTGIPFQMGQIFTATSILFMLVLILITSLGAGGYSAFVLSRMQPRSEFSSSFSQGSRGIVLRKILVLGQFAITTALIIGSIIINQQLHYMKNTHLGFKKEQKLILPVRFNDNHELIKNEFSSHPSILGMTASWSVPGRLADRLGTRIEGKEKKFDVRYHYFDQNFVPEYEIEIIAGRNFQEDLASDTGHTVLINETAAREFGFHSPQQAIGARLYGGQGGKKIPYKTIIGVTKDFHYQGLQNPIEPLVMQNYPRMFSLLSLSIKADNLTQTLSFVKDKWNKMHLGTVFSFFFLDHEFDRLYRKEEQVSQIFIIFTSLGILIASLGLIGLASFMTAQRSKEIGIRKVLGATVSNVTILLIKEFTKWVLLANIIAWPASYIAMRQWINQFAYRIDIKVYVFFLSAALAFLTAVLTVSIQTLKAATADPVKSLRHE